MVTKEVWELLQRIHKDIDEFIQLVGLEYTDNDEYICHNREQVDEEWCDEEMLDSICTAYNDLDYFLRGK